MYRKESVNMLIGQVWFCLSQSKLANLGLFFRQKRLKCSSEVYMPKSCDQANI